MELCPSPLGATFDKFIDRIEHQCIICSPYIGINPIKQLITTLERKGLQTRLDLKIITDISLKTLVSRSTDISALILAKESIPRSEVIYLPRIHAKAYVADDSMALVGSANFTHSGLHENLEYAVCLRTPEIVRSVSNDIRRYAQLGSPVPTQHLHLLASHVADIQSAIESEQRSIDRQVREASSRLQLRAEEELLRIRVRGRTINAIFSDTIEYLLQRRAMTTEEIHRWIKEIHPDLCDDTKDRIIDGQRFGKLWKHQVRTAQQHLKKSGRISYDRRHRLWHALPTEAEASSRYDANA